MVPTARLASALLLPALWLAELPAAQALQTLDAADGVTVEAAVSIKEPTRIRIAGAPIVNVFGNLHSSNCSTATAPAGVAGNATAAAPPKVNPAGELILECDSDKGEIYVRPVGASAKPINLFISSRDATYTLRLKRVDTPADTIVLQDRTVRDASREAASTGSAPRQPVHIRALKAMLIAMTSDRVPGDVRVEEVDRPMQLWAEARFTLTRLYEGRGLIGERFALTNVSAADMVLAEQEFDREGGNVLAISIETHNLRAGETTTVYVIRKGV